MKPMNNTEMYKMITELARISNDLLNEAILTTSDIDKTELTDAWTSIRSAVDALSSVYKRRLGKV